MRQTAYASIHRAAEVGGLRGADWGACLSGSIWQVTCHSLPGMNEDALRNTAGDERHKMKFSEFTL